MTFVIAMYSVAKIQILLFVDNKTGKYLSFVVYMQ